MVKDKNHFAEIKQMLDQFKTAIKKLEDQGVDVSLLEKQIENVYSKIELSTESTNEDVLNLIRKEALAECIFLRKKISDTIRKQIRDIIENEININ
ncbi:MAG: hypothetical protein GYA51_09080 [Candidatus Methanofastidiosa archaeon]|jgi:hypothetical protein|nr:hypothetical protein [Candidatus Methanofastidiosa archaeon]